MIYRNIALAEPDYSENCFHVHTKPTTIDFIKKILVKDPNRRLTMEEAFQHPFLLQSVEKNGLHSTSSYGSLANHRGLDGHKDTENVLSSSSSSSSSLSGLPLNVTHPNRSLDVMKSLGKFVKMSRFKKLMLEAVAFSLTPAQIAVLREEFQLFDTDRSGIITAKECLEYVAKVHESDNAINNNTDSSSSSSSNNNKVASASESIPEASSSAAAPSSAAAAASSSAAAAASPSPSSNHSNALQLVRDQCLGCVTSETMQFNYHEFLAAAMCKRIEIDEQRLILAFQAMDQDSKGECVMPPAYICAILPLSHSSLSHLYPPRHTHLTPLLYSTITSSPSSPLSVFKHSNIPAPPALSLRFFLPRISRHRYYSTCDG